MADNFRFMVMDAPAKAQATLSFRFSRPLPIKTFLERMDIPKLFSRASYWQGVKISFSTTGVDKRNFFVEQTVWIQVPFLHYKVEDVTELIIREYGANVRYDYDEAPLIVSMNITYM